VCSRKFDVESISASCRKNPFLQVVVE
jgi:hypothetical protein